MSRKIFSVAAVIDDLVKYDGKEVAVRGILSIQRENYSIADDYRQKPSRSLRAEFHYTSLGIRQEDLVALDEEFVIATGVIKRKGRGSFRLFPATLNIRRLTLA